MADLFVQQVGGVAEEPLSIPCSKGHLHGMCYRPAVGPWAQPVVLAAPDAEERAWSHRSLVRTARGLASKGFLVLRFDYRGQGESDLEFEHTSLESRVEDVSSAWNTLSDIGGRPSALLGVRLGAAVSIVSSHRCADIRALALWEPVLDTRSYVQQLLRSSMASQMAASGHVVRDRDELLQDAAAGRALTVNGFTYPGELIRALQVTDVHAALSAFSGELFVASTAGVLECLPPLPRLTLAIGMGGSFWLEPKIHSARLPAFLEATSAWLHALPVPPGHNGAL